MPTNPRDSWPTWTDEVAYWPTGTSEDDARWAASHLNSDEWHDQDADVPDEVYDARAQEAEAQRRYEDGTLL